MGSTFHMPSQGYSFPNSPLTLTHSSRYRAAAVGSPGSDLSALMRWPLMSRPTVGPEYSLPLLTWPLDQGYNGEESTLLHPPLYCICIPSLPWISAYLGFQQFFSIKAGLLN